MNEYFQIFISLGSNSADAENMLDFARQALARLPNMHLEAVSPVYSTAPQDYADQPWFLNQVVELAADAQWRPCSLVDALLEVEAKLGRVRSTDPALRFGPRTIDIDLLLFGEETSTDEHCLVPHPRLTQRAFALVPLLDLAPSTVIDGISAATWLSRLRYVKDGQRISQ
ncbi:MAG: 2-amino-4-hydroxy-6-hydroxymethyldihydropteridine diphosphokinase [Desulfovibrio sp.]|uniref:2-amino-4-hydroxy-6- hydroxymethyldihydropteridine diphosphokinase n=1 Tax=Desulfovibrio sp. TaxID=885 RepID=UPI0039E53861